MDTMSSTSSEGSYQKPEVRRFMDLSSAARRLTHSFEEADTFSLLHTSTQQLNEDILRETHRARHVDKQKASPRRSAPPPPRRAFLMPQQLPPQKPPPTTLPPPRALLQEVDYSPLTSPENLSLTRKQLSQLLAREKVLRADITRMPAHLPRPPKISMPDETTERLQRRIIELEAMLLPQPQVAQSEEAKQLQRITEQLQELEVRYSESCETIAHQEKEVRILHRRLEAATRKDFVYRYFSQWSTSFIRISYCLHPTEQYHTRAIRKVFATSAAQTDPYTPPPTIVEALRDEVRQMQEMNEVLTAKASAHEVMLPFLSSILPKLVQSSCSRADMQSVAAEFVQWLRTICHGDVALLKFKTDEFGEFLASSDDASSNKSGTSDPYLSDIIKQGVVHNPSKPSTSHQINLQVPFLSADVKIIGDRSREFGREEVDRLKFALILFSSWMALQKRLHQSASEANKLNELVASLKEEVHSAVSDLETVKSTSETLQRRLPSMLGIFDLITGVDECHTMEDIGSLVCGCMPQLLGHDGIATSFVLRDSDGVTYRVISSSPNDMNRQYTPQQWRNIPSFEAASLTQKQCTISFYDKDQVVFGGVLISRLASADRVGSDIWNEFSWRGLEEKFTQCIRGVMTLAVQRLHMMRLEEEKNTVMEDVKRHTEICNEYDHRLRDKDKEIKQLHEKVNQVTQELTNISRDATSEGRRQREIMEEYEERVSRLEETLAQKQEDIEHDRMKHSQELSDLKQAVLHAEAEARRLNNADVRKIQVESENNRLLLNRLRDAWALSQKLWFNGVGTIAEYHRVLLQGCVNIMSVTERTYVDGIVIDEQQAKGEHKTIDEFLWRKFSLEKSLTDKLINGDSCRVGQMLFVPVRNFESTVVIVVCLEKKFKLHFKESDSISYNSSELRFSPEDEEIAALFCNLSTFALHRLRTYEETRASIKQATLAIQTLQLANSKLQDDFAVEVEVKLKLHEALACGVDMFTVLQQPRLQVMNLVNVGQQHLCNLASSELCYFITPFDPEADTLSSTTSHFLISRYAVTEQISLEESDIESIAMESRKILQYPNDAEYCWTVRNQMETSDDVHVLCVPVPLPDDRVMIAVLARAKAYDDIDIKVASWFTRITSHVFRSQYHHQLYATLRDAAETAKSECSRHEILIAKYQEREEKMQRDMQHLEITHGDMLSNISSTNENIRRSEVVVCSDVLNLTYQDRTLRIFTAQFGGDNVRIISQHSRDACDSISGISSIHQYDGAAIRATLSQERNDLIVSVSQIASPSSRMKVRICCSGIQDVIISAIMMTLKHIDMVEQMQACLNLEREAFEQQMTDLTKQREQLANQASTDKAHMEKCLEEANTIYTQNLEAVKTKYKTTLAEKSKEAAINCDFVQAFIRTSKHIQSLGFDMISHPLHTKYSLSKMLKRISEILCVGGTLILCGKLDMESDEGEHKLQWFITPDKTIRSSVIPASHALLSVCASGSLAFNARSDVNLPDGVMRVTCDELPDMSYVIPVAFRDDNSYVFVSLQAASDSLSKHAYVGCECLRVALNTVIAQYNHIVRDILIRKHSQLKYVLAKHSLRVRNINTIQLSGAFCKWRMGTALARSNDELLKIHNDKVHDLEHKLRSIEANDADWAEIARGMTGAAVHAHDGIASLWAVGCRSLSSLVSSHVTVRGIGLIIRDIEDIYELEVRDAATPAPVSPATPHYDFFEHHIEPGAAALTTVSIDAMDANVRTVVNNIFHIAPSSQQWTQRMWKLKRSEYDDDQIWFVPLRTSTELIGILRIAVHLALGSDTSRDEAREETAQRVYLNFADTFSSLVVIARYVQDAKQEFASVKDEVFTLQQKHKYNVAEYQKVNTTLNLLSNAIESCSSVYGELDDSEMAMGLLDAMAQRITPVLSMSLGCRVEILALGSKLEEYDVTVPILTAQGESFATLGAQLRGNVERDVIKQVFNVVAISLGSMHNAMQSEQAAKIRVTNAATKLRSMEEDISEYGKLVDEISIRELMSNDKCDQQRKMCDIYSLCMDQQYRLLRMYREPCDDLTSISTVLCNIAKKLPELCQNEFVCSFGLLGDKVMTGDEKSYLDMSIVWYHAEPQEVHGRRGIRMSERSNQISMNLATACIANKEKSIVEISTDTSMGDNGLRVVSYPLVCCMNDKAVGAMQLYLSATASTMESYNAICEDVAQAVAHMVYTYTIVAEMAKKETELSTAVVVKEHALDDCESASRELRAQVDTYGVIISSLQALLQHCVNQDTLVEAVVQDDVMRPFEKSALSISVTSPSAARLHDDNIIGSVRIGHERNEVIVSLYDAQRSKATALQQLSSFYLLSIKRLDEVMIHRDEQVRTLQASLQEQKQLLQKIESQYAAEQKKVVAVRKEMETHLRTSASGVAKLENYIKSTTLCTSSILGEVEKLFKKHADFTLPSLSSIQHPERIINGILQCLHNSFKHICRKMHISILLAKSTHASTIVMFDGTNDTGVKLGKRHNESMSKTYECLQSKNLQHVQPPLHDCDIAGVNINCDNATMLCVPIDVANDVRCIIRVIYHEMEEQVEEYLIRIVKEMSVLFCPLVGATFLKQEYRRAAEETASLVGDMKSKIDHLETSLSRSRRIHRVACREVGALLDPPVVDMGKENIAPQHPAALTPVVAAQDICLKILSIIRTLVRSEGQALLLRDEDTDPVTYQLIYTGSASSWAGIEAGSFGVITAPPSGNCLVEQVMKSHKSLSIPDITADLNYWPPVDGQCVSKTPALVVPVRGRGNSVVGVIISVRGKDGTQFSQEDITAAEIAAGFASQSLYWCYGVGSLHIKLTKTIAKVEELEQHIRTATTKR